MLKKQLIMGIICIIFGIDTKNAYAQPDCITGSCNDYTWSDSANAFLCGTGDGQEDGACRCITSSGLQLYPCGCISDGDCDSNQYCSNGSCIACKTCTSASTGQWKAHATGYEKRTNTACYCAGGTYTYDQYRCAAGYYGSSSNGTSGCTQCPWTDLWDEPGLVTRSARTSAAGSTSVSSCYFTGGTSKKFYDVTGALELTGNCYY